MPTALEKFVQHGTEIDRLQTIHATISGEGPGRRRDVEVLHKAAFVLITAFWEAFCEDLATEALEHMLVHVSKGADLPDSLRKIIAKELKEEKNDLAIWKLADGFWREVVRARLDRLMIDRNRRLNTPKSEQIRELFQNTLGISDVTSVWHWGGMTNARAIEKLDEFIVKRGAIAHRGEAEVSVTLDDVKGFHRHVGFLAQRTHGRVDKYLFDVTGVGIS